MGGGGGTGPDSSPMEYSAINSAERPGSGTRGVLLCCPLLSLVCCPL
jgi:hypothetical protein